MNFWFVFTTRPGKEKAAASELGRRGLLPFVPVLPIKYRQGNRYWRPPAIPGYVLIDLPDISPRTLRAILAAEFANGERCVHKRIPGKVSAEQMLEFLSYLEALKLKGVPVKHSAKVGDMVRVKFGPLEGKSGQVTAVKGAKVNLLIELFKVEVKADQIQLEENATSASIPLTKSANHGTTLRRDGGRSSAAGGQSRI